MYTDAQRQSHINDLQRFLRRIEQAQGNKTPLVADGIFGPETAKSVRDFQHQNGLPVTGTADNETWDQIYHQYIVLSNGDSMPASALFFPTGIQAQLVPGQKGAAVIVLQLLLNTPIPHYPNFSPVPLTGEYDDAAVNAVKALQDTFGLPVTGIVDRPTWEALAALHNSLFESIPLSWLLGTYDCPV